MKPVVKEKQTNVQQFVAHIGIVLTRYFMFVALGVCACIFALGYFFLIKNSFTYVRSNTEEALQQEMAEQERRRDTLQEELKKLQDQPKEILYAALPTQSETASLFTQMEQLFRELGIEVRSMNITEEQSAQLSSPTQAPAQTSSVVGDEIDTRAQAQQPQNEQALSSAPSSAAGAMQPQKGDTRLRDVRKVTMDLELTGTDYDGLKKILKRIESFERITEVESAQYSNSDDSGTRKEKTGQGTQTELSSAFSISLVTYYLPEL